MRTAMLAIAAFGLALIPACDRPADAPASVAVEPVTVAEPVTPEPALAAPLFDAAALGIPTDADSIADGRVIAVDTCSNCHGIDKGPNVRADAPPLRYVLSIYPPESLAENFRAGIHVGHEDMPDFVFGDLGMDVLLAYLVTIQEAPPAQ
jgi:mono/diheme cytochrome c family protein